MATVAEPTLALPEATPARRRSMLRRPSGAPKGEGEHLSGKEIELLKEWIRLGAKMPDYGLPDDQITALTDYLCSLN